MIFKLLESMGVENPSEEIIEVNLVRDLSEQEALIKQIRDVGLRNEYAKKQFEANGKNYTYV